MTVEISAHFINDRRYERVGTAREAVDLAQRSWDDPDPLPDWAERKQTRAKSMDPGTYEFRAKGGYVFIFGLRAGKPKLITVLNETESEYAEGKIRLNLELHRMRLKS